MDDKIKILPDIFEALTGAIYIDTNFSFDLTKKVKNYKLIYRLLKI
jgi:dsRNA-specific ribonuclease